MHDLDTPKRDGAAPRNTRPPQPDRRSAGDHGRQLHRDAATLVAEIRDTTADLESYVTDQVTRRPYTTLGAAAGIGYVLGGGLRSRLTAVLLNTATRVAIGFVARELSARLSPPVAAATPTESP